MKDPFAVERAIAQTKIKAEKKQSDEFLDTFGKPLLKALKGDLEPLIKANKGADGKTPVKGTDYFTDAEIESIKADVLSRIPTPEDGKDAEVNYDLVFSYVVEQISKLPKPKDGVDGKDAIVDTAQIVSDVLKQIPKTDKVTVDYTKIQQLIDDRVKTIPWNEKRVVGYSSLKQLTDVILTGVPQDSKGNYILTPGGGGGGSSTWGSITGTLSDQTDLQTALNAKATPADITTAINNLVDTAPGTLDTLNELAAALGDDPNFATTVTTALAGKANTTHTHVIADTTGLQTALDGKAATSHTHTASQVTDFNEAAQDAVGGALLDSTSIDLIYDDAGNTISAQREALTGDVTASKNSNATTIANDVVTNAKAANMAQNTIKGRISAGTGDPEDLTAANVRTILSVETTTQLDARDTANRSRANHTGTQTASTISDFSEAVDDEVASLLVAGTNVTLTYNDAANTLTIASTGSGSSTPRRSQRMGWVFPDNTINPSTDITSNYWHTLSAMWYELDSSGNFVKRDNSTYGSNFFYTAANALTVRQNCTQALVNLSSGAATNVNALISSATKRAALITEMLSFCSANNFDGVDLDLETFQVASMSVTQYNDFKKMLQELGDALHAQGLILSMEVPPVWNITANTESGSGDTWDSAASQAYYQLRLEDLNDLPVDKVVVMAYDYQYDYGAGEPNQPLKWLEETLEFTRSKINENKIQIVAGLPAAGYSGVTGGFSITGRTYDYLAAQPGFSGATRNAASGELIWANGGISYAAIDDTAIQQKVAQAEAVGVYAYALWHVGDNNYGGTDLTTINTDNRPINDQTGLTRGKAVAMMMGFGGDAL